MGLLSATLMEDDSENLLLCWSSGPGAAGCDQYLSNELGSVDEVSSLCPFA